MDTLHHVAVAPSPAALCPDPSIGEAAMALCLEVCLRHCSDLEGHPTVYLRDRPSVFSLLYVALSLFFFFFALFQAEADLEARDGRLQAASTAKNAIESYVYGTRGTLDDPNMQKVPPTPYS